MEVKYSIVIKDLREQILFTSWADTKQDIKTYKFTPLEERYDLKMRSGDTYCIGEIKVRDNYCCNYLLKHGARLQHDKFEALIKEKKKIMEATGTSVRILYINICLDGQLIYELKEDASYLWEYKNLPSNNYDKSQTQYKKICDLQKDLLIEHTSMKFNINQAHDTAKLIHKINLHK